MSGWPMEEHASENCSIVYFCPSVEDDTFELYQKDSPPAALPKAPGPQHSLAQIYQNVRTLLDEDQGGFDEGEKPFALLHEVHGLTVNSVRVLAP